MQNGSSLAPREAPGTSKVTDNFERSPLHEAAINGDDDTLDRLLKSGVDRNAKDSQHGNTPLHEAAWRGYSRCVKLLCALPKQKAHKILLDVKAQKALQETKGALHSALLATRNFGGFTALHLAAQNGHNQSCREILLAGADPDVQNNYGDTPLHTSARYGHAGAVRILISAKCDTNRINLNGDTALHIAVAMGRRKLTRILLEAGCDKSIENAQGEGARDIAIRKNLSEIIAILESTKPSKSPHRDRSSSSSRHLGKDEAGRKSRREKDCGDGGAADTRYWSPYGCHYSPDPKDFPQPKLETLPKEPLQKGEQYYLDLAGNIRKGPIGVGNACYCAPLFRHLEHRISKNKKSIKKYVEKVDHKLEALATRTDDQIENLTKSIIANRVKCDDKKTYLKSWLKRGIHQRQSLAPGKVCKDAHESTNTLTRCRSLDNVDPEEEYESNIHKKLSHSVDLLNSRKCDERSTNSNAKNYSDTDKERNSSLAKESSTDKSMSESRKVSKYKINKEPKHIRLKKKELLKEKFEQDSLSEEDEEGDDFQKLHTTIVTKKLEKLLLETKNMIQKEKVLQKIKKRDDNFVVSDQLAEIRSRYQEYDEGRSIEAEMERITKTLSKSLEHDPHTSDENEELVDDVHDTNVHFATTSFNIEQASEDDDDNESTDMQQQMTNGFFMNTEFNSPVSSPATVRETPDICRTDELKGRILGSTKWRSNVLRKSVEEYHNSQDVVDSYSRRPSPMFKVPTPVTVPTIPLPRLSLMEVPKDAYFHELPGRTLNARNRNPLPMDVNENDILRDDFPAATSRLYSNVTQLPPRAVLHRPPIPMKPPHLAQPLLHMPAFHEHDSQNDSGYGGRLYDNTNHSHNPSPISNRLEELNGLHLVKQKSDTNGNKNEQRYASKIGSSSLV